MFTYWLITKTFRWFFIFPIIGLSLMASQNTHGTGTNFNEERGSSSSSSTTVFTSIGVLSRAHIPINCKTIKDVPSSDMKEIRNKLNDGFEMPHISEDYLRGRILSSWRNFKTYLYNELVKDKNPVEAISTHNIANRSKLIAPACIGRTRLAVIRHKMAVERNLEFDALVPRSDVYIKAHTKIDNTMQNPDLVVSL
ncbi:hypothetical protein GIB67_025564, partial [Kingdonia uniflora]